VWRSAHAAIDVAAEAGVSSDPISRCCDQPCLRLTRDERVTRLATLTDDGVLLVDDTPVSFSGATFDRDDKYISCGNCGTGQEVEDD
jgi:hypothetical protein